MSLVIIKLLIDFGLVVLIWMIQLIIYPSFLHYNAENLVVWHKKYTVLIGYIVIPLMLIQLGIAMYQVIVLTNVNTVIRLIIIILIWISTFLQFVPIHSNISKGRANEAMLVSLVHKNWNRTVLWTLLFLNSFIVVFYFSQDFL